MPRLLLIYGLIALVALVYWPSSVALGQLWMDYGNLAYTHGPLVAVVSLGLIWRVRHELAAAQATPWRLAYLALIAGSLAWFACHRAGILGLHLALLPLLMWLAVLAAFGWRVARLLAFPLGFLYFATTVFDRFVGPLQWLTVKAVGAFLAVAGVPAEIDGNLVSIPEGTFHVEGGCSGSHFFVVGLAIAALWGELGRDSWQRRVGFLTLMTGLALLCNWIRVFTVIMAGHFTDMQHSLIHHHYNFGWAVFAVALAIFFVIARRWAASGSENERVAMSPAPAAAHIPAYVGSALALLAVPVVLYSSTWARGGLDQFAIALSQGLRASVLAPTESQATEPQMTLTEVRQRLLGGLTLLRDGRFAEAEAELQRLKASTGVLPLPQQAMRIAGLIESRLAQRKLDEARASQQELEALVPGAPATRLLSARLALMTGDEVGGIAELQRLVFEQPDYLQARLVLGSALMARGSVMQAERQFSSAAQIAPENPVVKGLLAQARERTSDPLGASGGALQP